MADFSLSDVELPVYLPRVASTLVERRHWRSENPYARCEKGLLQGSLKPVKLTWGTRSS